MRPYEVMVIFDVGVEPPAIQAVIDRTLESIRTTGGVPGTVDRWGRRPFAYEVKHRREGYYVVIEFTGETPTVDGIDRMLALADEVLRHKVVRLPDKVAGRSTATPAPAGRGGAGVAPAPNGGSARADDQVPAGEPAGS